MSQDLKHELDDVRDELHSGLTEVRELVEQSRRAVFRMESTLATSDPASSFKVVEALEKVTAMTERTRVRQHWLLGLTLLQSAVLLGAMWWFSVQRDSAPRNFDQVPQTQPPATLSTLTDDDDERPAIAPAPTPPPEEVRDTTSTRKRRSHKRTHAVR